MKLSTALMIAAAIVAVAVWMVIEHARTRKEIDRLERDLKELRRPEEMGRRPKDSSTIGADGVVSPWM